MNKQPNDIFPQIQDNFFKSVDLFDQVIAVDESLVPKEVRNQVLLRRLCVSFLSLYEYLRAKTEVPQELHDKPLEDITDHIIKKGGIDKDDKDSFIMLGSMYSAIRWSNPGNSPDEDKIIEEVPAMHAFLKKVVAAHQGEAAPKKEASAS